MTMITLDTQIKKEEALLEDTRAALQLLRDEILELAEQLASGDTGGVAGSSVEIKKLNGLFNTCLETENRLGNCKERKVGIAQNGVAFDLEAARVSIGCKLNRLRACNNATDLSE